MANGGDVVRQAAAIPVRNGQICMVTSRSGKRWVVPKGCLEPGKSAGEMALQEAWEEAGLTGVLFPDPIGSYFYEKAGFTCHVIVFVMYVVQVVEDWPERYMRERTWLSLPEAILRTDEPGLRELLRALVDRNLRTAP
jgi:8-oxo-dGTP pyrophosphatase MutT (NUDIX family)